MYVWMEDKSVENIVRITISFFNSKYDLYKFERIENIFF